MGADGNTAVESLNFLTLHVSIQATNATQRINAATALNRLRVTSHCRQTVSCNYLQPKLPQSLLSDHTARCMTWRCVCLSVCLSVSFVHCIGTAEDTAE